MPWGVALQYNGSMPKLHLSENPSAARTRRHARAEMGGMVMIHNEERLFIAPLVNISAGGLFVSHLVTLPVGSEVKLIVKGERFSQPVQAEGTVVRVDTEHRLGLAVQFTQISEQSKEAIQANVYELRMEAALKAA